MKRYPYFFAVLFLLVSACASPSTPIPEAELLEMEPATGESTSTPTFLPVSTQTPNPTPTPFPTLAAPDLLSTFASNVSIDYFDPLIRNIGWGIGCECYFEGGTLLVGGRNWNGTSYDRAAFQEGQGVVMDFEFSEDAVSSIVFDVDEEFGSREYRSFGIYILNKGIHANLWAGQQLFSGRLNGNLTVQPEIQYTFALLIGSDGEFLILVWDPNDPNQYLSSYEKIGTSWSGRTWTFRLGADGGITKFDNFRIVSFDHIKE